MKKSVEIIKIVVIVLIVFIAVSVVHRELLVTKEKRNATYIKVSDLDKILKQGDIIIFSKTKFNNEKNGLFERILYSIVSLVSNTSSGHGSIVINQDNQYNILHFFGMKTLPSHFYLKNCNKSIYLHNIKEYIKYWDIKNQGFIRIFRKPNFDHSSEKIINSSKNFCLKNFSFVDKQDNVHCLKFLVQLLQDLGEIDNKKNIPYISFYPGAVCKRLIKNGFKDLGYYLYNID